MHTIIRTSAYAALALIAVASFAMVIVGLEHLDLAMNGAQYVMDHMSKPMAIGFFAFVGIACATLALMIAAAIEVPAYESDTRLGYSIASAVSNIRNFFIPMAAWMIGGGSLVFLAVHGVVSLSL